MASTQGFIVDCFSGLVKGRSVVFAMGRLDTGETFGLMDDRRLPTLYIRDSDRKSLKDHTPVATSLTTMEGEAVHAISTPDIFKMKALASRLDQLNIRTYEGDVDYAMNFLMENHLRGSVRLEGEWRASQNVDRVYVNPALSVADWEPHLRVLSFDIETDVANDRILAVSLVIDGQGTPSEDVLVLGQPRDEDPTWLKTYPDEASLLRAFAAKLKALDPDIVTGWNIIEFDLVMLQKRFGRYGIPWELGRTRTDTKTRAAPFAGRQILDAMRLVRGSALKVSDYKLKTVSEELLGRSKTMTSDDNEDQPAKILESYNHDRVNFATYCLEDSRLVRDILRKEKLLELAISRTRLVGLPLSRATGSVAPFEFIYMSELRQRRHVAPSHGIDQPEVHESPGGLVLEPQPGLYPHILVFDFRSLYPSLIRTFNIDPLSHAQADGEKPANLLKAPNKAAFTRTRGILPELLDRFFESRAEAQKRGDEIASYAYKIMMNSFYGVLGTSSCRFASPQLAGAITGFGHEILRWAKAHLEAQGFTVLYGDTDSLFVDVHFPEDVTPKEATARGKHVSSSLTRSLAEHLREKYDVESRLDLKFEKYYRWFLLPQSRGGASRAKSYAGLKQDGKKSTVDITGMEAVRSDWTKMARGLQRRLLAQVFAQASAADLMSTIKDTVSAVHKGKLDADLVYQKRIRRPLASYTSTTPPHVRAARLLPKEPRAVKYVMTLRGPQPLGYVTSKIDYGHYISKQVFPIVTMLADLVGFSAEDACRVPTPGSLFGD